MLNKVTIIGNLGNDPEIKNFENGSIANFTVATTEKWKDKSGEHQSKTEWHKIVANGKLVDIIEKYVSKGSKVYLEGKLKTRKWTDNTGEDKYITEIVLNGFDSKFIMLDSKGANQTTKENKPDVEDIDDSDSIPF